MNLGFNSYNVLNSSLQDYENFIKNAIVPIEFTNALSFGQTGSGKTTGFIIPNIQHRIKNNHNLIVFDYKANLINSIKTILDKHDMLDFISEVGVPWGFSFNLLDSLSLEDINKWLYEFDSNKDYWINSAIGLFSYIYEGLLLYADYCDSLKHKDVYGVYFKKLSFKDLFFVCDEDKIGSLVDAITTILVNIYKDFTTTKMTKKEKLIKNFYYEKFYEIYKHINKYSDSYLGYGDTGKGNKGVLEILKNSLAFVAKIDFLNDKENTIDCLLLQKIVLVIYSDKITHQANSLLNTAIFNFLKNTKNKESFTIFIDEANKVIGKNFLPEVSVCREFCFEYILSSQNELQLKHILGDLNYEQFSANIAHKISFYNPLIPTCDDLQTFEFKTLFDSKNKNNQTNKISKPYFTDESLIKDIDKKYFKKYIKKYAFYDVKNKCFLDKKMLKNVYFKDMKNDMLGNIEVILENESNVVVKIIKESNISFKKHQDIKEIYEKILKDMQEESNKQYEEIDFVSEYTDV